MRCVLRLRAVAPFVYKCFVPGIAQWLSSLKLSVLSQIILISIINLSKNIASTPQMTQPERNEWVGGCASLIFLWLPRLMFFLFLSSHPLISLVAYADVLAISFPASLIFLCLPRLMFYLFLSSHPPISLVACVDVLAISLPASLIFLCSHPPISLLP